jgi:hypothetical protein
VYSLEEDKRVVKGLTERNFLRQELVLCDSLVTVLKERSELNEDMERNQRDQVRALRDLSDVYKAERDELRKTLEEREKREKRRARGMTALIVLGCVLSGGLLLLMLLK